MPNMTKKEMEAILNQELTPFTKKLLVALIDEAKTDLGTTFSTLNFAADAIRFSPALGEMLWGDQQYIQAHYTVGLDTALWDAIEPLIRESLTWLEANGYITFHLLEENDPFKGIAETLLFDLPCYDITERGRHYHLALRMKSRLDAAADNRKFAARRAKAATAARSKAAA